MECEEKSDDMSDEPIRNFEVEAVPKVGMMSRLFGRVPREAAFVKIRNILATTPLAEIRKSDIEEALASAKLQYYDATKELTVIFEHAALLAVADRELSDIDRQGLATLQQAFELADYEASAAIESAVGQIFERVLRETLADGTFSEQKKAGIEATSAALGMSDDQTKRLYTKAASATLQAAFNSTIADQRYTNDEEAYITALAKSMGITITHDASTSALVSRFKLLARIEEGDLPLVSVPILLKRGEVCHFYGSAEHHQIKTITKRINFGGPTASIKIMKGVRWRLGSVSAQRVTSDVITHLDTGTLYITNKRLLYDGSKKNFNVTFGRITNFTVFKDGIQVEKDTGADHYFLGAGDWELAGACLDVAASKTR